MRSNKRNLVFTYHTDRCYSFLIRQRRQVCDISFLHGTPMKHVDIAEKLAYERGRRTLIHLIRRPDLLDIPLMHHHDTIGHF